MDVRPFLESGQLAILTVNDACMKDGVFDPDGMIRLLSQETGLALSQGYSALRVTGEMTWALKGLPGSERLIEYEAKLNHFFPGSACLAICQYDRRRFDPELLMEVLTTHPMAVVGVEVYENFYYISPREYLSDRLPESTLDHWIANLKEKKASENALRESEEALRKEAHDLGDRVKELNCLYSLARIVEQSSDGIVLVNGEGAIIEWNRAQEEIVGLRREEALGRYLWDVQHDIAPDEQKTPQNPERSRAAILASLKEGRMPWSGEPHEREIQRPDGKRRIIQSVSFPIRAQEGFMIGSITPGI